MLLGGHGRWVGDLFYIGDEINGGEGWDTAAFDSAVTINLASGVHGGEAREDTFISIEQFNGSAEADTFVASNAAGSHFVGGDGADTFYGGTQDDWFQGGKGRDYMDGGNGGDWVSYADAPNAITAEMYFTDGTTDGKITAGEWGLDTLINIENIEGTEFADYLLGDERSNSFPAVAATIVSRATPAAPRRDRSITSPATPATITSSSAPSIPPTAARTMTPRHSSATPSTWTSTPTTSRSTARASGLPNSRPMSGWNSATPWSVPRTASTSISATATISPTARAATTSSVPVPAPIP